MILQIKSQVETDELLKFYLKVFSERSEKEGGNNMIDSGLLGVRLAILFYVACVILSHPHLYPKIRHIWFLKIMGKIGGADYNDKWR